MGGLWAVVALGVVAAVTGLVFYGLVRFMLAIHSEEPSRSVTHPFLYPHLAAGAIGAAISLFDVDGGWGVFWIVTYVLWTIIYAVMLAAKLQAIKDAPHGATYYGGISLYFGIVMFFIGFYSILAEWCAIVVVITTVNLFGSQDQYYTWDPDSSSWYECDETCTIDYDAPANDFEFEPNMGFLFSTVNGATLNIPSPL